MLGKTLPLINSSELDVVLFFRKKAHACILILILGKCKMSVGEGRIPAKHLCCPLFLFE